MMTTTRKMTAMVWVTMTDDDIMLWRTIVMILTTMMSMSLTVIMMVRTVLSNDHHGTQTAKEARLLRLGSPKDI